MPSGSHPDAIDARLVLRVYAWMAIVDGTLVYMWPRLVWNVVSNSDSAAVHTVAAAVAALGCCAASLSTVDSPVDRRRALFGFALTHLVFGALFFLQWFTILSLTLPPIVGWAPLIVGLILIYLAVTGPGESRPFLSLAAAGPRSDMFAVRNKPSLHRLRSQYEEQIRQAARLEERAHLARDLHDAVKQQLFVIQTAAATAQARFGTDEPGTKAAIEQVRSSAREAMTEMDAMLEQLQAAPLENAGLVASLKRHAEALGFRTGAQVEVEVGTLPADHALAPGTREAIFRVAQEALSNVARHARATHVRVTLGLAGGRLALAVWDDGRGFATGGPAHGMGMANMAARASEIGGDLEVTSGTGRGTSLRFSVPSDPLSTRVYATRALWSGVLLLVSVGSIMLSTDAQPLAIAMAVIAGMAVARYVVAVYWLRRGRVPA